MATQFGYRTKNSLGGVQLDSEYKNFAVRHNGTITTSRPSGQLAYYADITVAATPNAQIAFRSTSAGIAYVRSTYSNGMKTFRLRNWSGAVTFEYWVFDDPAYGQKLTNDYGRKIYGADGSVIYDSRLKYMKVVGFITGTGDGSDASFRRNGVYPDYTKLAVIQASNMLLNDYMYGDTEDPFAWLEAYTEQVARITEPTVFLEPNYSSTRSYASGTPPPYLDLFNYNFMVINVAGF